MMDALALTKQLVAFASPSHRSNVEVGQFVQSQLDALGFETEQVLYQDASGVDKLNVIGRTGPAPSTHAPGLAYFCHSDVVPADEWSAPGGNPFDATEIGGRLYGRGSCDMKGSAACMLAALSQLRDQAFQAPIYFVCTADEERSYVGAKHVVADSRIYREMVQHQTPALIGEPTMLRVVHAHKGICLVRITSHGQAAHSATSEGRNANLAMIPFLQELKTIMEETESSDKWQNDEFDPPQLSWNIGLNDHTTAVNIKPAQSVCTVFSRPLPGVDDLQLLQRVQQAAEGFGLQYEMLSRCNAVYTPKDDPFVLGVLELAHGDAPTTVSYGTDAGELVELQHKVVCGPGNIAQAHTSDEWIDLEQLVLGQRLYAKFVQRWCVNAGRNGP